MTSEEATGRFGDIVENDRKHRHSQGYETVVLVLADRLSIDTGQATRLAELLDTATPGNYTYLARHLPVEALRAIMADT